MTAPAAAPARTAWWRNVRFLRGAIQIAAVAGALIVGYILWFNLTNNLRSQGITTGFDFLEQPIGVDIAGAGLGPGATIWRALLVGVKNTFALVVVGLPLVSLVGLVAGVARLSTNWLASKLALVYVELFRNLPPLLIIIFMFNAVILQLPPARSPSTPFGVLVVSNLQSDVPWPRTSEGITTFWWAVLIGLAVAVVLWVWRTRLSERTGTPHHRVLWALGAVLTAAVIGYFAGGRPITISRPELEGRVVSGGFTVLGSYMAVLAALVLYTGTHVAEIVRGSIQAVPKGQTEAANALALSPFQRLRYVTLPQALRIAIPPTINQYLNFTKNTSLAIAIGYAEITRLTFQAIGNANPAPQLVLLLMAAYLAFSLTISFIVNRVNKRFQLVTR